MTMNTYEIINYVKVLFDKKSEQDEKRHHEVMAAVQSRENNKEKVNGKS